ncbi:general transcription factor 3C polypeptide 5 [Plectropomus leopardus]|uniref:general transcription factor 3C polypeptide 5 n=1 Tax=Plectropomus leopardus TaxID=160734 RepID=UPI001C4C637F|nr:general transcription factor 3C polypeptide 5 [Plectropomus leopardus]
MAESKELKLDFILKELSLSPQTDAQDVPGSSSSVELQDHKLVCVEYPAVVTSVDKMLETLGGEKTVSKTYAHPNRRLEMRYRPQDPFCHSLCGNRFPSSNLVLRVRRRVRKKDPKDSEIHMEILGVIGTTYKFQGMADFQYLAVHTEGGKETSLYDKIILRKSENQEFFEKPMPFFLPPASFSRLDSPVDYFYRADHVYQKSLQVPMDNKNFIGWSRARRPHNAIFVSFADPTVPAECLEAAKTNWVRVCIKESDKQAEEQLKKMFESRPIWSRNAVKANINIHPDKLKLLLPIFAYYMVTGPWRSLWVRLGYDPRKCNEAKKYQLLDFRIRCSTKHGYSLSDMPVKAKRSALNYSLPITFNKTVSQAASVMELSAQEGPSSSRDLVPVSYQLKESSYIFKEGMLPPHRQMFYQLCDLDVESIKQVLEEMGNNEEVCDERDGWCVVGTTDKLRDMISAMIKKVIRAQKPPLPEYPKKRRRRGLSSKLLERDSDADEEEVQDDENRDDDDDEDEDEVDEFQPSEGSENEMETEILDYM